MPPQPHSSMGPGKPYLNVGMCAMGHPCMCAQIAAQFSAQHWPQAAHFYPFPVASQPVSRKRGRPRGSKDVVPRARKFTLVKKNFQRKGETERSGDDDTAEEEDGADTRSSRDGDDDATSNGSSSAQEACDEKSMPPGPGLEDESWEPPIAVVNAKASASLESLWSFDGDIAPKGQFSQQSSMRSMQYTEDAGELELVDQDWFQNHEQLFGRRKNVS
jgi:hypothetical protein